MKYTAECILDVIKKFDVIMDTVIKMVEYPRFVCLSLSLTAQNAASDQGLNCLLKLKEVKG